MVPKKLTTKRARKTVVGEGCSTAPLVDFEFHGHHFRSEEHQCCFELIKDWSFIKERRIQLEEG